MTQTEIILQRLKDAPGGVPNYELADISLQYNARIWELRRLGWDIQRRRVERAGKQSNTYIYFIQGVPPVTAAAPTTVLLPQPGELFDMPRQRPKQMMDPLS